MTIEGMAAPADNAPADPTTETPQTDAPASDAAPDAPVDDKPEWEKRLDALLEDEGGDGAEDGAGDADDGESEGDDDVAHAAEEGGDTPDDEKEAGDEAPAVLFPGRHEADGDFEVKVTPALRAALEEQGVDPDEWTSRAQQLKNEGMRRRDYEVARQEVEAGYAELDALEQELATRPADFLADRVSEKFYGDVARRVLLRMPEDEFDKLIDELAVWDRDPSTRKLAAAQEIEDRTDRRTEAQRSQEQRGASRQYAQQLAGSIADLVPESMADAEAEQFFDFAVYKLEQWAQTQAKGTRVKPEQIPALLKELGALAPYGLSGDQTPGKKSRPTSTKAERQESPSADDLVERAQQTGKKLQQRAERRKNASAVTPAGVGAGAAPLAAPKGQSFKDRMEWLEKRLGLKT